MVAKKVSLSEIEVAVIRNLLASSQYSNQEILGKINTIRRAKGLKDINSGRISEIKKEDLRYTGIKAASDIQTTKFLTQTTVLNSATLSNENPLNPTILEDILPLKKGIPDQLLITETTKIECKESINTEHWALNHLKTVSAFANNEGGYLVFGVKDQTWEIIGIDSNEFNKMDLNISNRTFRSYLSCPIYHEKITIERNNKILGIIYIPPAKIKPVIITSNNNRSKVNEGQIYYRNQGENRLINAAELQFIIEDRIKNLSQIILSKHLNNIVSNGIENSAVLNIETGVVNGKSGGFVIDESILPKIKFIKEGEFTETSGAPTLKLIGDVQNTANIVVTKEIELIEQYPYSWKELWAAFHAKLPTIKQSKFNNAIKTLSLKSNKEFSAYNFSNKKHREHYGETGQLKGSPLSIYNEAALQCLLDNFK